MNFKHATIVPLIGGETLGQELAFGTPPEYFMSYEAFWNNDKHIVNHYEDIPYYVLDKNEHPNNKVDVIGTVCPCAGLSQLSHGYGDDNANNKWMIETANYVLGELKPRVFWGENAPGFAGKIGDKIRNQLYKIGLNNGYTMTVYRTKSLFHGISQVRERSFYFFWRDTKTPMLSYYNRPRIKIEDTITSVKSNFQMEPINTKIPSRDDPYYRFALEHVHGGITHAEFCKIIEPANARGNDVLSYLEKIGTMYEDIIDWMGKNDYPREVEKCKSRKAKLEAGYNIMRRGTVIPRDYIGAFVGHYPTSLTHPVEDRYITYREAMSIMGMPENFELLDQKNCVNHICQNVPVQTACDMATEILAYLNGEREMIDSSLIFQYNHSKTHDIKSNNTTLEAFLQ